MKSRYPTKTTLSFALAEARSVIVTAGVARAEVMVYDSGRLDDLLRWTKQRVL